MAISNDEILAVSLTLFSQNGYDGTSLQDIADCLKVTKGALFKHYDSKEALWNALIDKVEGYYGEHFGMVKNISLPDTLEELCKLTLRQVDFTIHDETVKKVRKLLTIEQFRNERMSALATKHFSGDIETIYTDIFEHLMKNGRVKTDNSSLLALGYTSPITIDSHSPEVIAERAKDAHFYAACDREKIIGCGGITGYWGSTTESYLLSIFVLPKYQGRGIGRRIVETLENDEYFSRAWRTEVGSSVTAVNFYRKLGYEFKNGITEPDEFHVVRLEKRK